MSARSWGAVPLPDGRIRFRTWAPEQRLQVQIEGRSTPLAMNELAEGWHELITALAAPGTLYRYVLADGTALADPASAFQPQGVQGPSEVVDLARYRWRTADWPGRPWHETVLYELHVGTFTPEGTFLAAAGRLPYLAGLGITAVELMPVAQFAGARNWGYDGVLPYAPACCYGRPEELQAFVDAAHQAGIMVMLDVVYNHLGPEGNPLAALAPRFYTDRHKTPWGAAFDFSGSAAVRDFFIGNALYWLEQYRLDGLRLDAVHAITDDSGEHIVDELARVVREELGDRNVHLILENEHNEAGRLARTNGKVARFTAQWNDDAHHVLHVAATGEAEGYYADYRGDLGKLARALAEGFAFQGESMGYRGSARGEPSAHLPPEAFIAFLQNHDQVGNRAFGERLGALAPVPVTRALAALYLLLPQIPMLFMGEEWGASSPFPFFCDFGGELGRQVTEGRRAEFARFAAFADPGLRERIPDPVSPATFASAVLDWSESRQPEHAAMLELYRALLAVRRSEVVPLVPRIRHGGRAELGDDGALRVTWQTEGRDGLVLTANLQHRSVRLAPPATGRVLWCEGSWKRDQLAAWTVHWSLPG